MSPGPTFDRVYASLKEQLLRGRWAPGAHLEPAVIGEDLNASITPVRDALHRLVGERLIDAPRHDGFWVPSITETQLRDLYAWNGGLLAWALRRQRRPLTLLSAGGSEMPDMPQLFLEIARNATNAELEHAIAASSDRLAEFRSVEGKVLTGGQAEAAHIGSALRQNDAPGLRRALAAYHRRRQRAAPLILTQRRATLAGHRR